MPKSIVVLWSAPARSLLGVRRRTQSPKFSDKFHFSLSMYLRGSAVRIGRNHVELHRRQAVLDRTQHIKVPLIIATD